MNNTNWLNCKDPVEMLEALKSMPEQQYSDIQPVLHRFYIDCCEPLIEIWPDKHFIEALEFVKTHSGVMNMTDRLRKYDYYVEASIFGLQYSPETNESLAIVKQVGDLKQLDGKSAFEYAVSLGYFIDWVLLYMDSWRGKIPYKYSQFLDANIIRRYIKEPFND